MKRVLVLTSSDLKNPMRGTPLRICAFIKEIAQGGMVTVVARSIDADDTLYRSIPMPVGSAYTRLRMLRDIVKREKIDWIFTPTDVDIKMVILLKLLCGVRIAIDIHGVANEEAYFFGHIGYFKKIVQGWLLTAWLYFFDAIFVVSKKMGSYYGAHARRVQVVYGGVDTLVFSHCATYRDVHTDRFEVTYMGNTRSYQGLSILIDALTVRPIPHLHLRLIMTGDQEEILSLLTAHNLDRQTTIHTDIPHHEVAALMRTSDVLVIPRPSIPMTEYAYPSKLPECVATGIPVVATDVGPVSELFTNKVHCVITTSDHIDAFAEGIAYVAGMSKEEREQLGTAGRTHVAEHLSWKKLGETIRGVFK